MKKRISICFFCFLLHVCCSAQDFNYTKYDIKDGLPSNTVYDICQDKDGFMWFSTDAGISRFDGTHFVTFTSRDGLPDNEALKLYADKKGRVWIAPFKNDLCYYYNGKIYNKSNTPFLRKIKLKSYLMGIAMDDFNNLMIFDKRTLYYLNKNDSVKLISEDKDVSARRNYFSGGFRVMLDKELYTYTNNNLTYKHTESRGAYDDADSITCYFDNNEKSVLMKRPVGAILSSLHNNHVNFIGTLFGAYSYDTTTHSINNIFFKGQKVSRVFEDKDGNVWFGLPSDGIYKLSEKQVKKILLPSQSKETEIFSFAVFQNKVVAGANYSQLHFIDSSKKVINTNVYDSYINNAINKDLYNRAYCSKTLANGDLIVGFDAFLMKLDGHKKNNTTIAYSTAVKSISQLNATEVVVASSTHLLIRRIADLKITDTILKERTTSVLCDGENIFAGTLKGLVKINLAKKSVLAFAEKIPLLNDRITFIEKDAYNNIWVGTYNNGIIVLHGDKQVYHFNSSNGLPGDNCRCIAINNNAIYIGTNKGLCSFNYSNNSWEFNNGPDRVVQNSDIINALAFFNESLYIGTPSGITVKQNRTIKPPGIFVLKLMNIKLNDSSFTTSNEIALQTNDKLLLEFSAIDFSANPDIKYLYKLTQQDGWDTSVSGTIFLGSIPSNATSIEVKAYSSLENKFSNLISIPLNVSVPFFKSILFYALTALAFVLTGLWIIYKRLNRKRQEEQKMNEIENEILSLRYKALQAQMNPHFIFNCLNAVQDYLILKDIPTANKFLVSLASLIRKTLEYSSETTITLADEIKYLNNYLAVEQMRFENKFDFNITTSNQTDESSIKIPTMIIQPFVENAIKHGIGSVKDKKGLIDIIFTENETDLVCRITDNGIGVNAAAKQKGHSLSNHKSIGLNNTMERIDSIYRATGKRVNVIINDLAIDNDNAKTGTCIELIFEI